MPYETIFKLANKYNSINVLDASQSYGIKKIEELKDINFIVFAGHKSLYASFGVAGYINVKKTNMKPFCYGGTGSDSLNLDMPEESPTRFESGSANIVAISGLNASLDWLSTKKIYEEEKKKTDYLISQLKKNYKVKIYIPEDIKRIFGVVSFSVNGYSSDEVGKILNDEFEICVRTGYHCAPLVHDFIGSKDSNGTVRISLSYFTTKKEIDMLIDALNSL